MNPAATLHSDTVRAATTTVLTNACGYRAATVETSSQRQSAIPMATTASHIKTPIANLWRSGTGRP
jgi:hypothetical protein